jgi:hypothetical protein
MLLKSLFVSSVPTGANERMGSLSNFMFPPNRQKETQFFKQVWKEGSKHYMTGDWHSNKM